MKTISHIGTKMVKDTEDKHGSQMANLKSSGKTLAKAQTVTLLL